MSFLIDYFRSPYHISVAECEGRNILNFLTAHDIPFRGPILKDDNYIFLLYAPYFKEYARLRGEKKYRREIRKRLGFLALLTRYRKRKGLLVGALLALFLLIGSTFFVWDIRVTGMETLSEDAILSAMAERGLSLGAFIPTIDTEHIEQAAVLEVEGLSRISINLRGTVAQVEVRERANDPEIIDRQSPSNLIAAMDGQIEALEVTGGVSTVAPGEIVKKGDLLVSGIIDSNALGYRLVRARGVVTARTTLTYEIEIPFLTEEKVYTGEFLTQKFVKFFSKTIKLFGKDSISYPSCDKIEVERRLYLFDTIKLPIFISKITYAAYELQPKILTEEEARAKAYLKLREMSENDLADAEILGRHITISSDENALYLSAKIECIVNIAEEVKIETE